MPKIALYGHPGAGKSTFAAALAEECERAGAPVCRLKLGAPLYAVQSVVYAVAGRPLSDTGVQDGPLLNALGSAMRRINPEALTAPFAERVREAEALDPKAVLICDDMRASDMSAVLTLGFHLVEVAAPDGVRRRHKAGRGDLAAGDDSHPTEAPVTGRPWWRVDNDGTIEQLRGEATRLVREVLR
ncbi:AAA family ATPase [Streptomyces griseoluteus]|uniref:AAA family ATPase n=1 Tax=Streptomyces griseoluteus TaxID=29306 RepID=UPI003684F3C0